MKNEINSNTDEKSNVEDVIVIPEEESHNTPNGESDTVKSPVSNHFYEPVEWLIVVIAW